MTQLDIMKTTYNKYPKFTSKQIQELKNNLNKWRQDSSDIFLLYCLEKNYFTIFQLQDNNKLNNFGSSVVDLIYGSLGKIVYAKESEPEDYSYEIWIKANPDADAEFYLLMNWDEGAIKYNG